MSSFVSRFFLVAFLALVVSNTSRAAQVTFYSCTGGGHHYRITVGVNDFNYYPPNYEWLDNVDDLHGPGVPLDPFTWKRDGAGAEITSIQGEPTSIPCTPAGGGNSGGAG